MESNKILEILNHYKNFWVSGALEAGIEREILPRCLRQMESKEILLIKGVRRSGKSTLMAQMIRWLLEQGTKPAQVLRVNLEEPLFAVESSIGLLERIYRAYRDQVNPSGKCFLFLDEMQNIPEWERWIRGRSETNDLDQVQKIGEATVRCLPLTIFLLDLIGFLPFPSLCNKGGTSLK